MSEQAKNAKNAKKVRLSRRAQIALTVVALLLVAALGWFVLVSPTRSSATEVQAEIEAVQAQIDDRRAKALVPPPPAIRSAELFRLAKAIPDTADMSGVILELNRVAAETGIEFEKITPQPPVTQGAYQVLPISVIFDGNFYALSDFLFRLRNLVHVRNGKLQSVGRLFLVDTLQFDESDAKFPYIKATLTIDAFVFGTGAGAPAGAAPAGIPATAPPPAGSAPTTTTTPTTTTPAGTTPTTTTPTTTAPTTPPAPAPAASGAPATGGAS